MRAGLADAADRSERARAEERVLGDQGAVEVAGEGRDAGRESVRKLYGTEPPVDVTTNAETFAISWVVS